jgi:type IX secretion system PorP/SprF family membrane protein
MKRKSSHVLTKSIVFFIVFLILNLGLKAQEDTYWIGLSFKNPAAIATPSDWVYGVYSVTVKGLTDKSLKLYSGAFDYKISQKAGTIGLDFSYQKYNIESALLIKANYAYDIQVFETSMLSFGVSAGTTFYKNKLSEYEIYDPADPNYIPPTDLKYNFLNGNAGVFLHSPRLSTGLSLTFERLMNGGDGYTMPTILTGVLAYRIVNNDVLVITPNFMVDYVSENFSSIPGLQIKYKNAWAGYQNLDFEDFHSINLGADIKTKFRIGYSYSFSEFLSIDGLNIHEFVLGYRLQ